MSDGRKAGGGAETVEAKAQMSAIEAAERAVDAAYGTGKAERAKITQMAQLDAAEAVAMAGIAMEADEAMRISVIAERLGDRERAKAARKREREARRKANAEHKAATKSAKRAYTTQSSSVRPTRWASCAPCRWFSPDTSPCTSCSSC